MFVTPPPLSDTLAGPAHRDRRHGCHLTAVKWCHSATERTPPLRPRRQAPSLPVPTVGSRRLRASRYRRFLRCIHTRRHSSCDALLLPPRAGVPPGLRVPRLSTSWHHVRPSPEGTSLTTPPAFAAKCCSTDRCGNRSSPEPWRCPRRWASHHVFAWQRRHTLWALSVWTWVYADRSFVPSCAGCGPRPGGLATAMDSIHAIEAGM